VKQGVTYHSIPCSLERKQEGRLKIRVRRKLKVQNSSTFQGLSGTQIVFSSTKIIDKKPYSRRGHSKFRLQCDTEVYCTILTNTVMIKASDRLSTNAKFARFKFKDFSSTFKHLICFQALSRALKFLFQIQAFSKISQHTHTPV